MQPIQLPVTQVGLEQSIQAAMKKAAGTAQINLGTNSRQINALSQPLGRITGQADEFTKSMAAANARVLAFGASAGIMAGVSKALAGIVTNTIKVEKSLANINVVLNKSGAELEKFGNQLFDVAKNTGQTFDQVAEAATELARQGLDAADTLNRLNDSLILSRLSGLDATKSVEGLTAAYNSFASTGVTTSQILNKLVVVAQKYAVSEKDLIEGLKRSSAVANQAGVSLDELVGIITAVQEKTARGGAVIGNSFKTIFSRIQDRQVLSDLDSIGIKVLDLQGKVLPATSILQNLATSFKSFSQLEQADIAEKLGGIYQLSNLLAAIEDLGSETSKYKKAVQDSATATTEAYAKNAALNQTLDALINKATVSAEQLGATLGKIGVTDSLKNILSFFNGLLEGIQKILGEESALGNLFRGIAKGIGNFAAGPGLALFGAIILKLSKDLVQFGFASLKSFFGIGKAAKEVQNVEMSIQQILTRNVDLQQKLFALEGDRAGQLQVITRALVDQEALLRKTASTASSLAPDVYNVGGRATPSGLRINPPTAAGGYVPAVAKESADISRGVGGARGGDKPVVIPNFNFGGGKRGSMVAHTGEYIVPNFQGKGSAVFNRDMVRSMGLPSGARKIGAAGGFVPNFAEKTPRGVGASEAFAALAEKGLSPSSLKDLESKEFNKYVSVITGSKGAKKYIFNGEALGIGANVERNESQLKTTFDTRLKNQNQTIDAAKLFGSNLPPILTPNQEGLSEQFMPYFGNKRIKWQFPAYKLNVAGKENVINKFQKNFDKDTIETFALNQAKKYAQSVVGLLDQTIPIQPDDIKQFSSNVKGFLPSISAAFGGIFDAAVTVGISAAAKESSGPAKKIGGDFDVNMRKGSKSYEYIKTLFGGKEMGSIPRFNSRGEKIADKSSIRIADFKINAGKTSTESMAGKIMDTEYFRKALEKEAKTSNAAGGYIPNFASMRSVGYLDGDVLSDPQYADIVKAQIQKLGIKGGVAEYHKYLGSLASKARTENKIKKFTSIFGVPGAGKSTMMLGGGNRAIADNATLRKTNRIPILTPEDIYKVSEIVDTRASVGSGTMDAIQGGYLSNVDKMTILSTSTKEEQLEVLNRRKDRDEKITKGVSDVAFGRSAGTSTGAPVDSAYIEALALSILGSDKVRVMGIQSGFKLKRKKGSELPMVEEKRLALAWGAFALPTRGHKELQNMATSMGIPVEDLIVAVSKEGGRVDPKDPHSWRTAIFDQGFRKLLAKKNFPGANVIGADPNLFQGGVPTMFEVDPINNQRRFLKAGAGSVALVGSDKTEKDLEKYIKAGYQAIVGERTEGISGTSGRQAMMDLNNEAIAKIFTKDVMAVITEYLPQIKNRGDIFPEILNRSSNKVDKKLLPVEAALAQLPSRITPKVDPAIAEQILALRDVRDKMKKLKERYPNIMLKKLGKLFPSKYGLPSAASGFIPNFAKVGDFIKSKYSIENSYKKGTQYTTDSGSSVKVSSDFKNKILNLDHIKSNKKGDAYSLFQHVVKLAKRSKSQIYSKSLEPQGDILNQFEGSQWEQLLKVYPQLRYRNQKNLLTSGRVVSEEDDFSSGLFDTSKIEMEFGSLDEFRKKVNGIDPIEFKKIFSRSKIADLQTKAFSGGYIPNFADKVSAKSGSDVSLENGILKVGFLNARRGNPLFEILKLLDQGKIKGIDAGAVIGPKIPDLIVGMKKIMERKRLKDPSIPRIPIQGFFRPAALASKISERSEYKFKNRPEGIGPYDKKGIDYYGTKDQQNFISALREMGLDRKSDSFARLEQIYPNGLAGGYIPNFANPLTDFLGGAKFIGSAANAFRKTLPKDSIKTAIKQKNFEPIFGPLLKFFQNPSALIKSNKDLENAKRAIKLTLNSDLIREAFAKRVAPLINSQNYNVSEVFKKNIADSSEFEKNAEGYAKYKLFGGTKNLSQYAPEGIKGLVEKGRYLKITDPKYKQKLTDAAAGVGFGGYKTKRIDKKGNYYAENYLLGGYTGRVKETSGKKYASYKDRWDVDLHGSEKEFLRERLNKSSSENKEYFEKFNRDYDEYDPAPDLNSELGVNTYNASDINSFILRELVSAIPKAKPVVFKGVIPIASKGYLPNFANPLQAAVGREMAAGVPASQIYIDKSPSLKSAANPMGLMVANRRDEPAGGFQGINRAVREGRDPKMYGAAGGFVPNYAVTGNGGASGGVSKVLVALFAFQSAVSVLTGFLDQAGESGKKLSETLQKVAGTALIFGGIAFSGPIKRLKEFSNEVFNVTKNTKSNKGGILSGYSQGFKKGLGGEAYEFARPTGSQARRDRLSNRYNLSNRGLASARFGAIAGGVTRGAAAVAGSVLGPATLAIGAFKVLAEGASGFRTYSNAAAKSLGEMSVYANKASESLSELDKSAVEAQVNKSSGYGFGSLLGSLSDITGASTLASAISGQKISNTNFQGRNLELSNVSEEQFKQVRQAYITSYVGANRTKFAKAEDAAGVASQEFANMISGQSAFDEYDVESLNDKIKEFSKQAQLAAKENELAKAMEQAKIETQLAERDLANFNTVLGDTQKRFLALKDTSFVFQKTIDSFKGISEAAIDNAYNFSEYDKSIAKLNISISSLNAGKAVKELTLIAETQEKLKDKAKDSLKGFDTQAKDLQILFEDTLAKISSGEEMDIQEKDLIGLKTLFGTGGTDAIEFLKQTTKEFQLAKKELNNQNEIEINNLRIEQLRSLQAQETTAALENQNKQLELQQSNAEKLFEYSEKIRNSRNKISDLKFDRSLIGATQTQRLGAQIGREAELERRARQQSLVNFKQDRVQSIQSLQSLIPSNLSSESQFSLKSQILEASQQIRNQKTLSDVSSTSSDIYKKIIEQINSSVKKESESRKGFIESLKVTITGSSVTFSDSVVSAAQKFKDIVIEAADYPKKQEIEILKNNREEIKNKTTLITLTAEDKAALETGKRALEKLKQNVTPQTYLIEKERYLKEFPKIGTAFQKEEEMSKNEEAIQKLSQAINKLEESLSKSIPNNQEVYLFGSRKPNIKTPFTSSVDPLKFTSDKPEETPAPTALMAEDQAEQALKAARLSTKEALLEISNATANASDELEKMTSVSRILSDSFAQLQEGIPAAIASITSERNRSISGSEISKLNYDLETQRQLAGAGSREEADKIMRDRQNKPLSQLFDEKFSKTTQELSLNLKNNLVESSEQFKNNLVDGLTNAIDQGGSLGDILRSAAYDFVKNLNRQNISTLFDSALNAGKTGVASLFASGGRVTGGSGSKDDVPAMLMGGEYVINKRAVQKYGPQFFDSINNGQLSGYADGGMVADGNNVGDKLIQDLYRRRQERIEKAEKFQGGNKFYTPGTYGRGGIQGKNNLLNFATQTGTSGRFDRMVNIEGYQSIALEPESSRLSLMGMRNSPAFEATQSAKQQAFDLYLQQYRQEQEAKKAEKEQKKAFRKQLMMLAITSIGGAALSKVGNAAASGAKANIAAKEAALGRSLTFGETLSSGFSGAFKGGDIGGQQVGGLSNLFSGVGKAFTGDFAGAANQYKLSQISSGSQLSNLYSSDSKFASYIDSMGGFNVSGAPMASIVTPAQGAVYNATTSMRGGMFNPALPSGGGGIDPMLFNLEEDVNPNITPVPSKEVIKNATGGMIPYTSGIDTVPAMLSGGEFIMNRAAVQNIGAANLQSMNSGATSAPSAEMSKDLNEKLIAKLDELIQVSGSSGDININVSSSDNAQQQGSQEDASSKKQQLARQIRDAVLQVIQEEKRIGGTLRR
jgi:TP901 family phage tail tape measure protein